MNDNRRRDILNVIEHFKDNELNQDTLDAYCKACKIDTVTMGELQDHMVQAEHDMIMAELTPKIIDALKGLRHMKDLDSDDVRNEKVKQNDGVRVKIVELVEETNMKYVNIEKTLKSMANFIGNVLVYAGTTADNKGREVMLHLAEKHFGHDMTAKDVNTYIEGVYKEARDKKNTE